jgi:hypothetical protein
VGAPIGLDYLGTNRHKLFRIGKGQWAQHCGVDDRKNRGTGSNSQGER